MSLPFLWSGVGPAIAYEAAIKLRRVVWLNGVFLEQHSTLAHIVLMMMSKAGAALWECVADRKGCGHPHAEGRPGKVGGSVGMRGAPGV